MTGPVAIVLLPRSLVALFPGAERRVNLEAATVGDAIDTLDSRWPGMRDRLCESRSAIRGFINVFVDGAPADLRTPLEPGSTVHVLPAVAGG